MPDESDPGSVLVETDYPAAHSMDSAWFAVDKDGHIAHFSTGEAGARPFDAVAVDDPEAVIEELAKLMPRTEVVYELHGNILPGPLGRNGHHDLTWASGQEEGLFFLRSLEPIRKEIASGAAVEVPGHGGLAVIIRKPSKAFIKRLHDANLCLGCCFHWQRDEEDESPPVASLGLFDYGHLCENWISGPYGLEERPRQPLHIDQLPPHLRREMQHVFYRDFCFAKRVHIQPIEYEQCPSWQSAYLSSDGLHIRENTDAVIDDFAPDDYPDEYDHFTKESADWLKGIQIHPPRDEDDDE